MRFKPQAASLKNKGLSVNQHKAGKKCIGTASPYKSSGFWMLTGRVTANGTRMLAKEIIVKLILKIISALVQNNLFNCQYPRAARRHPSILIPIRLAGFIIFEKRSPSANMYTRLYTMDAVAENIPALMPRKNIFLNINKDLDP
jgi:hypothetical protein